MGVSPLFCCFRNQSPLCVALTGLITNVVIFAFLCWPADKLVFFRTGLEAVFWIGFVLILLCLICFIIITIFLFLRQSPSYKTLSNVAKIMCLAILIMCFIAWVFILTAFIGGLKDYVDVHDMIKDAQGDSEANLTSFLWKKRNLKNKVAKRKLLSAEDVDVEDYLSLDLDDDGDLSSLDWATVTFPLILNLIGIPVMALCANYLFKVFRDDSQAPIPMEANPNIVTTTPVVPQPGLFPNNAPTYPVTVQQTNQNFPVK